MGPEETDLLSSSKAQQRGLMTNRLRSRERHPLVQQQSAATRLTSVDSRSTLMTWTPVQTTVIDSVADSSHLSVLRPFIRDWFRNVHRFAKVDAHSPHERGLYLTSFLSGWALERWANVGGRHERQKNPG